MTTDDSKAALRQVPRYTGRGSTGDAEKDDLRAAQLELLDIIADREAEIALLREALAEIVGMARYITSPTRLDLAVTLGRAIDRAKAALGQLEAHAALASEAES